MRGSDPDEAIILQCNLDQLNHQWKAINKSFHELRSVIALPLVFIYIKLFILLICFSWDRQTDFLLSEWMINHLHFKYILPLFDP